MRMRPRGGFVKTGEQVEHGGLAGTGGSDEGDGLAGQRFEREVVDGGGFVGVGERDVFEPDVAGHVLRAQAFGEVGLIRRVDDFENALRRDDAAGEGLGEGVDARNGIEQKSPGDEEGNDHAGLDFALQGEPRAEGDHQDDAGLGDEGDAGPDDRLAAHDGHVFFPDLARGLVEGFERLRLHRVGLDLADAGEVVVEDGVERGGGFRGLAPHRLGAAAPPGG